MQINRSGKEAVIIKTKTEPITIGKGIEINGYTIPGPGEYDIASIQCEGYALPTGSVAYFLRTEELTVTYLPSLDPELSKLDDAASTNILVVDIRSDDSPEIIKSLIKSIEPSYVILIGAGATSELFSTLGIPVFESSTLKVTRSGLPLEGTWLLPLD